MKKRIDKKGISPVVATILLVAIVIVIALIIFLWLRNVVGDYGEKFGKNIELICEEVHLAASYSSPTLYLTNDGNVPVFKINVKIKREGSYETDDLDNLLTDTEWPETGLMQGGVFAGNIAVSNANEIIILPVLIGTSDKGNKKTYTCEEQYGYQIVL